MRLVLVGMVLGLFACKSETLPARDKTTHAQSCSAACEKLIDCWETEIGSPGAGETECPTLVNDDSCGEGWVCAPDTGSCPAAQPHNDAVALCVAGCTADAEANQTQLTCLKTQACPSLLSECVGVSTDDDY